MIYFEGSVSSLMGSTSIKQGITHRFQVHHHQHHRPAISLCFSLHSLAFNHWSPDEEIDTRYVASSWVPREGMGRMTGRMQRKSTIETWRMLPNGTWTVKYVPFRNQFFLSSPGGPVPSLLLFFSFRPVQQYCIAIYVIYRNKIKIILVLCPVPPSSVHCVLCGWCMLQVLSIECEWMVVSLPVPVPGKGAYGWYHAAVVIVGSSLGLPCLWLRMGQIIRIIYNATKGKVVYSQFLHVWLGGYVDFCFWFFLLIATTADRSKGRSGWNILALSRMSIAFCGFSGDWHGGGGSPVACLES